MVEEYKGFVIDEDRPSVGYDPVRSKYPFRFKYRGHVIDRVERVEIAKRVIDKMPDWLQYRVTDIDMWVNRNGEGS